MKRPLTGVCVCVWGGGGGFDLYDIIYVEIYHICFHIYDIIGQ